MSDFDLSSFLAEQASGGTSQGGGGFTISHEKAARKMAEYSLPREYAWVLKLIQAGVSWGCTGIKITQTRVESTIHFEFSQFRRLPTNKELVTAILRADLESSQPLDAFAMGLRLLVEKSYLSFLLLIDTGDVESQAIYAGVYFGEMDEEKRAARRTGWGKGITLKINHIAHTETNRLLLNYATVKRHGLPLLMELEKYAFTCPVPLTIDGRRIDGVFRVSRFAWSSNFKPLRATSVEVPDEVAPPFVMSPGFDNQTFTVFTPRRELAALNEPVTAEAFVLLAGRSQRLEYIAHRTIEPNTLYWVRDGVVVDQDPLPKTARAVTLYVFVNAEGIRSDLTGFQLLRDRVRQERSEQVLQRVAEVVEMEAEIKREVLAKPPKVNEMDEDELSRLPRHARAVTRSLQRATDAIEGEEYPHLKPYRKFARSVILGAYSALQTTVSEPDYWTRTPFRLVYFEELKKLAKLLESGTEPTLPPLKTQLPDPSLIDSAIQFDPDDDNELPVVKEKFSWKPPDER